MQILVRRFEVCEEALFIYFVEVLFTLFNIIFKWSLKDKRLSRTTPKCFCELVSDTLLLLKVRARWYSYFVLLLNITS